MVCSTSTQQGRATAAHCPATLLISSRLASTASAAWFVRDRRGTRRASNCACVTVMWAPASHSSDHSSDEERKPLLASSPRARQLNPPAPKEELEPELTPASQPEPEPEPEVAREPQQEALLGLSRAASPTLDSPLRFSQTWIGAGLSRSSRSTELDSDVIGSE